MTMLYVWLCWQPEPLRKFVIKMDLFHYQTEPTEYAWLTFDPNIESMEEAYIKNSAVVHKLDNLPRITAQYLLHPIA